MDGKQLRNSILQWAIQGKLVPQDPNDEPASVLLERIREEKARLVKEKKIKRDKNESIIYRGDDNSYYEKFTDGKVVCIDDEVPFDIPFGWEWCRLGCLCSKFSTGPFGTMVHKSDYTDDGIPLVNPTNIKGQQIVAENICKVALTKYDELRAYVLSENDIVLARRGDLSKCAIVNEEQIGWLAGTGSFFMHIMELSLEFFIMLYTSPYAQDYLIGDSVGTTMNNLNQGLLSRMLIPIPPLPEQSRIIEHYRFIIPIIERYTVAYSERKALDNVLPIQIKKSVLQEAIQGKLVPQDLNDEPASILLQRIKEEKQRLVKEGKLKKKDVIDSTIFRGDDNKYFEKRGKDVVCIDDEIPFDIPDSWTWCRIKDIFLINPKNNAQDDIDAAFIPMEKIDATYLSSFTYSTKRWGEIKKGFTHFADGDVAFAKITPCFQNRKSMILRGLPNGIGAGTTELKVLRSYGATIIIEYLLFFLESSYFVDEATFKGTANQQRIISGYLENKLFPLPPLQEQQRIVDAVQSTWQVL